MSKSVRVTLTDDYDHGVHGEQRVFRAGDHMLPIAIAKAAHAAGKIEGPAPVEDPAAEVHASVPAKAARKRVRKPKAKPVAAPAAAKPFPAAKPAKKPTAASGSGAQRRRSGK